MKRWIFPVVALLSVLAGSFVRPVQASAYTQGAKKVLFIRVDFADKPGDPISDANAKALITTTFDFYKNNSYNTTSLTSVTVTPLLRMSANTTTYTADSGLLMTEARALASAAGFNYQSFDHHVLGFATIGFGWAGLGYVGAPGSWLNGYFGFRECGHEIGHNLGLLHANYWKTNDGTANGSGKRQEYGDPFDTMGGGGGSTTKHFNTWFKNRLDWLPNAGVQTVLASGTYRIEEHDNPAASGIRAIKIAMDGTRNYWIEFRQQITGNNAMMNGASIRWGYNQNDGSDLLDMTPETPGNVDDAPLVIGRTFDDNVAGIHITPIKIIPGAVKQLEFNINMGANPGNNPPTVSMTASATSVGVGVNVDFTATSSDPDGDTLVYSWDFADGTFAGNTPTATKKWTSNGNYTVRCTVNDQKGGKASATVAIKVGSPNSLRISGRVLAQCGSPLENATVTVEGGFTAVTDSQGKYSVTGLRPAKYTVTCVDSLGATVAPANFTNPVDLTTDNDAVNFGSNTLDVTPPILKITSPKNLDVVATLASYGTANDGAGCGIERLELSLYRRSDKMYWNGTIWVSSEVHLSVTLNGTTWSKSTGLPMDKDLLPGDYDIGVKSYDKSYNESEKTVRVSVPEPPTITITAPLQSTQVKSLAAITGSADDPTGAGIASIRVSLHRLSDNKYFDGGVWASVNPLVPNPSMAASYDSITKQWIVNSGLPSATLLTSDAYRIEAKVVNVLGRSATARSSFIVDRDKPQVTFTKPKPNGFAASLATITGTAVDNAGGTGASGIVAVAVQIQRNSDLKWWTGTIWGGKNSIPASIREEQFSSSGGAVWSAPAPGGRLPGPAELSTGLYTVTGIATDKTGNKGVATMTVTVDIAPPSISITTPRNGSVTATLNTTGTAKDNLGGGGVDKVEMTIKRASDGLYWNGSAWVAPRPAPNPAFPTATLVVGAYNSRLIREYDAATGAPLANWTDSIVNPESIIFGNDHNGDGFPELFAAERSLNRVVFYDGKTRAKLGVFAQGGGLVSPTGLAFMPNGDLLVANGHSENVSTFTTSVKRYDGRNRTYLGDFVLPNSGNVTNGFEGMCYGNDANGDGVADLYVSALFDHKVVAYSGVDGSAIRDFVTSGSGGLSYVTDVTFGPDATNDGTPDAYVCSSATDDIKLYDGVTGAFVRDFVADTDGATSGLNGPERAIFGPDGNLYVASFGQTGSNAGSGSAVLRFNSVNGAPQPSAGRTGAVFCDGINGPAGLAFNPVATGKVTPPVVQPGPAVPPILTTTLNTATNTFERGNDMPNGANLLQGTYVLVATATDRGGNVASATSTVTVGSVPVVSITTPANGTTVSTLPKIEGTALGSNIQSLGLYLSRKSDGLFWTGTTWGAKTALSNTLTALTGTTGVKFARSSGLPTGTALAAGGYRIEAIATNNLGLKGSNSSEFTVQSGSTGGSSDVLLSQITATASTSSIKLIFTGALDATTTTDPSRYSITINGRAVQATLATYSASNASVTLKVMATELVAGNTVQVSFSTLRDTAGRTVSGVSEVVTAGR